jgi:hypothetical protein
MDTASQEPRRGTAGHRPHPRLTAPHLTLEHRTCRSSRDASGFGALLVMAGACVRFAGFEDQADVLNGGPSAVLRAGRAAGVGLGGFGCTGWQRALHAEALEPAVSLGPG